MNKVLGIILLLLSYNNFAEENIYNFVLRNNMEYPYNIETNINDSRYIDRSDSAELDKNGYIVPLKLANKQKKILAYFFELLKLISEQQHFSELKNQNDIIAFSIQNINLYKDNSNYEFIGVPVKYYSNKKIGDMSTYNEHNVFWETHNIAIYSINDYNFLGPVHTSEI